VNTPEAIGEDEEVVDTPYCGFLTPVALTGKTPLDEEFTL
jgi:hypothetical protein